MSKLDASLDPVLNTRFLNTYKDLIKRLARETIFDELEVQCILMVYYKFVLANGPKAKYMTTKQFNNLFLVLFKVYDLQIIENILLHITNAKDLKKELDPAPWVELFAVFMSTNLERRMRFAFQIYNGNTESPLNREMVTLAVGKFFNGDDEDEVNELRLDMVETIFKKFDVDRDGVISFDDYATTVRKQPLLLEFLGQCFPNIDDLNVIAYCNNILSKVEFPTSKLEK